MNAIKHTKLTMALAAALVAGAISTNAQAQTVDFSDFSRQARANAMNEATSQPGPAERINELRGALEGARVVSGLPSADDQRALALAAIRAEQLEDMRANAAPQMKGSLAGVRVVSGLPSASEHKARAIASIRHEQLNDLRASAPSQLSASMQAAQVMTSIADVTPVSEPKNEEWSLPEVEFKPLIDMSILHFSFKK